jgi:intraflagellar transport protein 46
LTEPAPAATRDSSSGATQKDALAESRNPPAIRDSSGDKQQTSIAAAAAAASTSEMDSMYAEAGAYNAMDYKHLNVSDDVRELFKYIGRFKPQSIELETKLKPFIPDYIPAVGGIDEFIKVPRPDGKADYLGLKVKP